MSDLLEYYIKSNRSSYIQADHININIDGSIELDQWITETIPLDVMDQMLKKKWNCTVRLSHGTYMLKLTYKTNYYCVQYDDINFWFNKRDQIDKQQITFVKKFVEETQKLFNVKITKNKLYLFRCFEVYKII